MPPSSNLVELDPEANRLLMQIAAARAQLAQDVAERLREDFGKLRESVHAEIENFKVEVRASLHVNADLTAQAIANLERVTLQAENISRRLVEQLTTYELRQARAHSESGIVVTLAEQNLAEQRLELEQQRQELARVEVEHRAELERKAEDRAQRWALVKQIAAGVTSVGFLTGCAALLARACGG